MEQKLLELKNDLVFQELFGKQKNSKITGHLLSLILGKKVRNVDLDLNKRMLGNREDSKTGRLDIRVSFNDGEDCNIELQVLPYEFMDKRMLEYWANMYGNKMSKGEDYKILKPSISILIADYRIPKLLDIEEYHTKWNLREEKYIDKILTEDMEMHILEIPKVEKEDIATDELALWLKFIESPVNKEVQQTMEEKENKYLKQAMEELGYLSGDPGFKRLIEARVGFLKDEQAFKDAGMEAGMKEGMEKGIKKGKKKGMKVGVKAGKEEVAKELLKRKFSIKEVAEITGLTEKEIEKIK